MGNERARISEREMPCVTIINGDWKNTLSAPKITSSSLSAWGNPQTNKTSFLSRSPFSTSSVLLHSPCKSLSPFKPHASAQLHFLRAAPKAETMDKEPPLVGDE